MHVRTHVHMYLHCTTIVGCTNPSFTLCNVNVHMNSLVKALNERACTLAIHDLYKMCTCTHTRTHACTHAHTHNVLKRNLQ